MTTQHPINHMMISHHLGNFVQALKDNKSIVAYEELGKVIKTIHRDYTFSHEKYMYTANDLERLVDEITDHLRAEHMLVVFLDYVDYLYKMVGSYIHHAEYTPSELK